MTHVSVASIGSYPRTGEEKDHQRYPRALGHFERKEISAHALRDVEQSVVQEVIREQIDNGAEEVTDGLITWSDPITRFARHVSGVKAAGLARTFDTNTYHRTLVIVSKPKFLPVNVSDFVYARNASNKPVRAVLTGPLTLARFTRSDVKPFDKLAGRVALFTEILCREVDALVKEKAPVIQIDEPALLVADEAERRLAAEAIAEIGKHRDLARLALAIYYAPVAPHLTFLTGLPVDVLHLDLTADGKDTLERLPSLQPKATIGLGIADGRSTRMESVEEMSALLRPYLEKAAGEHAYVSPSCGLEFLPRPVAAAKLRRLAELRDALGGRRG
jgi:5-methyltetrahydropteroyltriglutamate--homocysteine methyltransferase